MYGKSSWGKFEDLESWLITLTLYHTIPTFNDPG